MRKFWVNTVERCGLLLDGGKIVELKNTSDTPGHNFLVDGKDFERHEGIVATWHTHPRTSANLSVMDWAMFKQFPETNYLQLESFWEFSRIIQRISMETDQF